MRRERQAIEVDVADLAVAGQEGCGYLVAQIGTAASGVDARSAQARSATGSPGSALSRWTKVAVASVDDEIVGLGVPCT